MTIMTNPGERIAGTDSHKDTIHIAVITNTGLEVADREFRTTTDGYRRAVSWQASHGPITTVGVEETSSYGVGITAALRRNGLTMAEANRTRPAERRKQGKTDRPDAYHAARSALPSKATTNPKHETIEPPRTLMVTRRNTTKALHACWRQISSVLVNASSQIRDKYRNLNRDNPVDLLIATRPSQIKNNHEATTLRALRSLARHHQFLRAEIDDLNTQLDEQTTAHNPKLRAIHGIDPALAAILPITTGDDPARLHTQASFAALCGTGSHPRLLQQNPTPPPLPRRRPTSQLGTTLSNQNPHKPRPAHPRPPPRHQPDTHSHPPRHQPRTRPRSLPSPQRPLRYPQPHRPTTNPPNQKPHPHQHRQNLPHLTSPHPRHRTRQTPKRHPHPPLPRMTHHRSTPHTLDTT